MIRVELGNSGQRFRTSFLVLVGLLVLLPLSRASAQVVPPTCPPQLGTVDIIDHNFSVSFCELCSTGHVRIEIENPLPDSDNVDFANLIVTENLMDSGLTYVANSTTFTGTNISVPVAVEPTVSGVAGRQLSWDLRPSGLVMNDQPGGAGTRARLFVDFDVERHASVTEEGLVLANRTIDASVMFEPSCAVGDTFTPTTGPGTLPLDEPEVVITKQGRNLDAGQGGYSSTAYGHIGDDVIWRIRVRNDGDADLQDFIFDDSITPGNFEINYVCDDPAEAVSAANGGAIGDCDLIGPTTSIAGIDVAARFGGGANPYIVAPAGASGFYYLVGRITDSCSDETNTVSNVEWGCQSQPPAGGISATSGGTTAGDDALLRTRSVTGNVGISVALGGINPAQAMGATGTVTITITNTSGGTIHGEAAGLRIRNLLPPQYVVDPTFTPTIDMDPAYGSSYPGMIDTVTWTNPHPNTVPVLVMPGNPADPLSNTELQLLLTSSTTQTNVGLPDQTHMIRHGDVVTITLRTVLIDPTYYDYVANLDVRAEGPASDPPGNF